MDSIGFVSKQVNHSRHIHDITLYSPINANELNANDLSVVRGIKSDSMSY